MSDSNPQTETRLQALEAATFVGSGAVIAAAALAADRIAGAAGDVDAANRVIEADKADKISIDEAVAAAKAQNDAIAATASTSGSRTDAADAAEDAADAANRPVA